MEKIYVVATTTNNQELAPALLPIGAFTTREQANKAIDFCTKQGCPYSEIFEVPIDNDAPNFPWSE